MITQNEQTIISHFAEVGIEVPTIFSPFTDEQHCGIYQFGYWHPNNGFHALGVPSAPYDKTQENIHQYCARTKSAYENRHANGWHDVYIVPFKHTKRQHYYRDAGMCVVQDIEKAYCIVGEDGRVLEIKDRETETHNYAETVNPDFPLASPGALVPGGNGFPSRW